MCYGIHIMPDCVNATGSLYDGDNREVSDDLGHVGEVPQSYSLPLGTEESRHIFTFSTIPTIHCTFIFLLFLLQSPVPSSQAVSISTTAT